MALQKQTLPINFFAGLDLKTDPKQVIASSFLNLENIIFKTPGSLSKRNGLSLLSNRIHYTDETINTGQALANYKNQLLLFTGSKAYSRLDYNDKWNYKGDVSSIITQSAQIVSNGFSQSLPDANKINNLECFVYEQNNEIYYSILDSETNNFLINNKLLATGNKPQVHVLEDQFIIFYLDDTDLCYAKIYLNSPTINPTIITLDEAITYDAVSSNCKILTDDNLTSANVRIYLTYQSLTGFPKCKVFTSTNTMDVYTPDPASTHVAKYISITSAPDTSDAFSINSGLVPYILWLDESNKLHLGRANLTVGAFDYKSFSLPFQFYPENIQNITFTWDNSNFNDQIKFKLFFQFKIKETENPTLAYIRSLDIDVKLTQPEIILGSISNMILKKGIGLYSKPFVVNNNVYITAVHESDLQSVYFVLDQNLNVTSKIHQNNASGLRSNLCNVYFDYNLQNTVTKTFAPNQYKLLTPVSDNIFYLPTLKRGKIQSENNTIFSNFGVLKTTLDFISPNHFLSEQINDNLYVVGGVLQNYDNNKFTEAGFHLYPENVEIISTLPNITQIGNVFELNKISGSRIRSSDYIKLTSGDGSITYILYFVVDDVGSPPDISAEIKPIKISSNTSIDDLTNILITNINLLPEFSATVTSGKIQITSVVPGSLAEINTTIGIGSIDPGTYLYICVWKYIDNAGRIHRSTTSIPKSIEITSTQNVTITVPLLSPTAKSNVILDVYRTFDQGTDFRRVTSLTNPVYSVINDDPNFTSISFIDTNSDSQIASNELLHTTGGVLDNDSPPSSSIIAIYNNRLFLAGLDDKNKIQYTKTIDNSDTNFVAGFSDFLTIQLDENGGNITALKALDDKLIIFKENQIYYISGDGPNNLGQGSFNLPQLITTDTGCNNPNSVVVTPVGLMFSSKKGIYLLDRGLNVDYIGAPVEKYNDLEITSSILLNKVNQVRFITSSDIAIIYDYYVKQWSIFTNYSGNDCTIFQDKFCLLRSNGYLQPESNDFQDAGPISNKYISITIETANIKTSLLGFQRTYRFGFLGEFLNPHKLSVSFAYDYSPVYTEFLEVDAENILNTTTYGSSSPYGAELVYGGNYSAYMLRAHLKHQKNTAIRIKIKDLPELENNEGLSISGLFLQIGVKSDIAKLPYTKSLGTE